MVQSQPFPNVNDWYGLLDEDWQGMLSLFRKILQSVWLKCFLPLSRKGDLEVSDITDLTTDEIDLFISLFSGLYENKGNFSALGSRE